MIEVREIDLVGIFKIPILIPYSILQCCECELAEFLAAYTIFYYHCRYYVWSRTLSLVNVKNVVVYCYYFPTSLALGQVCEAYFIQ